MVPMVQSSKTKPDGPKWEHPDLWPTPTFRGRYSLSDAGNDTGQLGQVLGHRQTLANLGFKFISSWCGRLLRTYKLQKQERVSLGGQSDSTCQFAALIEMRR